MSHRPLKVDIEFDRWSRDLQIVGAEDRGDLLPEGTSLLEVDHVLVVLQTDPELGPALPHTLPTPGQSLAAVPVDVLST